MNRRDFNTSIFTGAAALACGTIAAGGDAKARGEDRGAGLKVGDEVMYVKSKCSMCGDTLPHGSRGVVCELDRLFVFVRLENENEHDGLHDFCRKSLVRVIEEYEKKHYSLKDLDNATSDSSLQA